MQDWIKKDADPFQTFSKWFDAAVNGGNFEPTAMTLATVDASGTPSARIVLLKDFSSDGFRFFTNYTSQKGKELSSLGRAALVFHWQLPLHRQVRVRGLIEKVSQQQSNSYFQSRPRGSQIGAWASPQSQEIQGREELKTLYQKMEDRFGSGPIPCPDFWGGFVLKPLSIEFWQAQEFRLHDRIKFTRPSLGDDWTAQYLAP